MLGAVALLLTSCGNSDWEAAVEPAQEALTDGAAEHSVADRSDNSLASDPGDSLTGLALLPMGLDESRRRLDSAMTDLGWDDAACVDADSEWVANSVPTQTSPLNERALVCGLSLDGEPYGSAEFLTADAMTYLVYSLGPDAGAASPTPPPGWSPGPGARGHHR